jgi:hypothetical protein
MKGSEFWIPDLGLIEVFFFLFSGPHPFLSFLSSSLCLCSAVCSVPAQSKRPSRGLGAKYLHTLHSD